MEAAIFRLVYGPEAYPGYWQEGGEIQESKLLCMNVMGVCGYFVIISQRSGNYLVTFQPQEVPQSNTHNTETLHLLNVCRSGWDS